jgi:hypothetical protein
MAQNLVRILPKHEAKTSNKYSVYEKKLKKQKLFSKSSDARHEVISEKNEMKTKEGGVDKRRMGENNKKLRMRFRKHTRCVLH